MVAAATTTGYIYNSANATTSCAGATCDITNVNADMSACCKAPLATCGDKNGAAVAPSPSNPITDSECDGKCGMVM